MTATVPGGRTETAEQQRRTRPFALALTALTLMMLGASAPSPFYPVLRDRLGFSAFALTAIFAVYAVSLLVTLLVAGSVSDHLGRRPVISVGFLLLALSMAVFWHADSVTLLVVARVAQGAASGVLLSALSATVVDLEPTDRPGAAPLANSVLPLVGLGVGALVSGLVLDELGSPLALVFGTLTAVYLVTGGVVWLMPESSPGHDGFLASLRPRVSVPAPARETFLRSGPAMVAGWATGGLYLSLGASLVGEELGGASHVDQGLVVTILMGVGALSCYLARNRSPREITLYGTSALALGTLLTLLTLGLGSLSLFLAAVVLAGSGFGTSFLGVMRSVTPTVGVHERGELFAAVFTVSYLSFGLPAVAAGLAAPELGLVVTTYAYGAVIIVLSTTAALMRRFGTTD